MITKNNRLKQIQYVAARLFHILKTCAKSEAFSKLATISLFSYELKKVCRELLASPRCKSVHVTKVHKSKFTLFKHCRGVALSAVSW